jgi:1,4-dihydroxy-2-naphthoate octaprenyltransferase
MNQTATATMSFAAFAAVARAPFLLLSVTLVAAGTGAAAYLGMHDWAAAGLALLGMLGAHVAVNALNEASDYRTGIDLKTVRTPFSGGSGTLPAGRLSYRAAVASGLTGGGVAVAVGLYFLTTVGWKLVPILAVGALAVFAYSYILARLYVGELFAGLGLGALPIIGTTLVQTGGYEPVAVATSLPAFFMTFNLLLLNEFPDEAADREGGRRNLVLLLGRQKAALLYALFGLAVPASLIVSVWLGYLPTRALLAILPSLLLVAPLSWAVRRSEQQVPHPALGANVGWNLLTNVVLAAALAI